MTKPSLAALAFACAFAIAAARRAEASSIVWNPGFESPELTAGEPPKGFPYGFSDWAGDDSRIVTTENGVVPFEGTHMLRFISSANPTLENGLSSDIWQLLDMSPFAADIATGLATVTWSAYFNRIPGDAETEPQFAISVRAFSGLSSGFPDVSDSPLSDSTVVLMSDADAATWQFLQTSLLLPSNTTYIGLRLAARETINNSPFANEFAGHYADNTALDLDVVPEPASLALIGSGLAILATRLRKSRRGAPQRLTTHL